MRIDYTVRGEQSVATKVELSFARLLRIKLYGVWVCRALVTLYGAVITVVAAQQAVGFVWVFALFVCSGPLLYWGLRALAWFVIMVPFVKKWEPGKISQDPDRVTLEVGRSGLEWKVGRYTERFSWDFVRGVKHEDAGVVVDLGESSITIPVGAFTDSSQLSSFTDLITANARDLPPKHDIDEE